MKKNTLYIVLIFIALLIGFSIYVVNSNNYKREGSFNISTNKQPIKINRDENGVAYIFAESKEDAIRGQGFVLAQDRIFQIEFYRALIKGEAASLVGSAMLQSDIKMRVLNLVGNAERSYKYLDTKTKEMLDWYCQGF